MEDLKADDKLTATTQPEQHTESVDSVKPTSDGKPFTETGSRQDAGRQDHGGSKDERSTQDKNSRQGEYSTKGKSSTQDGGQVASVAQDMRGSQDEADTQDNDAGTQDVRDVQDVKGRQDVSDDVQGVRGRQDVSDDVQDVRGSQDVRGRQDVSDVQDVGGSQDKDGSRDKNVIQGEDRPLQADSTGKQDDNMRGRQDEDAPQDESGRQDDDTDRQKARVLQNMGGSQHEDGKWVEACKWNDARKQELAAQHRSGNWQLPVQMVDRPTKCLAADGEDWTISTARSPPIGDSFHFTPDSLPELNDQLERAVRIADNEMNDLWLIVSDEMVNDFAAIGVNTVDITTDGLWFYSDEVEKFAHFYQRIVHCFNDNRLNAVPFLLHEFRSEFKASTYRDIVQFFRPADWELLRRIYFRYWLLQTNPKRLAVPPPSDVDPLGPDECCGGFVTENQASKNRTEAQTAAMGGAAGAAFTPMPQVRQTVDNAVADLVSRYCRVHHPSEVACALHDFVQKGARKVVGGRAQEEQDQWNTLKDTLLQARDKGRELEDSYDPASGGLDSSSADHAAECLLDMETRMEEARYDWCWLRVHTLREVFGKAYDNICVSHLMSQSDLGILQLVFYHSKCNINRG